STARPRLSMTETPNQIMPLAIRALRAGDLDGADAHLRQILTQDPGHAHALHALGLVAIQRGRKDEAVLLFQQAIHANPNVPEFHGHLGAALAETGQLEAGVAALEKALALRPNSAEAHNNLAIALKNLGRLEQAEGHFQQALRLQTDYFQALTNLGNLYQDMGRWAEAESAYAKALEIRPNYAEGWLNLGTCYQTLDRLDQAMRAYRRVLEIRPDHAGAHNGVGFVYHRKGLLEEALQFYRRACELDPQHAAAQSNVLVVMNYFDADAVEDPRAAHEAWCRQHAGAGAQPAPHFANVADPDRRLRIGYVSPDFRRHSVAFFIEPVIAGHHRQQVEVFCYSNVQRADAVTDRIEGLADHWRDIRYLDDQKAEALIRDDGIDILVDLIGQLANNRLPLFARRPAPVQMTYLGYPNTTGLPTIDYRLTDVHADPPGLTAAMHTETLVRLEGGFLCYQPPADAPPVSALPAATAGHVTFGSFNNLLKLRPPVIALWARILAAVEGSTLTLKGRGLDDRQTQDHFRRQFKAQGVAEDRITLLTHVASTEDHLGLYGAVDIALDPFPYNGTTTTCEALWMGVPVVTLAGDRHAGRVGVSLLHAAECTAWIADSLDAYVQIAADLAADISRLGEIRRDLRPRMQASRLMDAEAFTGELEATYRQAWRTWCEKQADRSS
ncbi:MAG: tetratricopeptide repeat protein, partial [Phycisphaerae bacterium]|nr:tetratricopeptide repeat protein [Phycisphaerae bacterium]